MDEEQNKQIKELIEQQKNLRDEIIKNRVIFAGIFDRLFQLIILAALIGMGFYTFEKLTPEKQSQYSEQFLDKALIVIASAVGVQQLAQNKKKVNEIKHGDD